MKTKHFMKKVTYTVLLLALVVAGFSFWGNKKVKAAGGLTEAAGKNYSYLAYSDDMEMDQNGIPQYSGYLFAGWYKSEDCTTEANALQKGETPGEGDYAKFVKRDTLNVLAQGTLGKVTSTNVYAYMNKYVLRLVSSVDSLDYRNVGFEVKYTVNEVEKTGRFSTKDVYTRIVSTTGEGDSYAFSPKIVSTKAEHFITAKITLDEAGVGERNIDTNFKVRAFWETLDGTVVYGEERYVCYNDGTNSRVVTMHVTGEVAEDTTYTVAKDGVTIEGAEVQRVDAHNVKIILPDGNSRLEFASVTEIALKQNGTEVGTVLYRNLYSGYDPSKEKTVDTSWYDKNSTGEEFVIVSNADLYGMANILAEKRTNFSSKTIYLATDIKLNDGLASDLKDIATDTDLVVNAWVPLGKTEADAAGYAFNGTFDGQLYSISGIICNRTTTCSALFHKLNLNGTIKNLKIKNSYFNGTAGYVAAIVGQAESGSKIDTVYVEADVTVESSNSRVAGIVAMSNGGTISKCWNAGTVVQKSEAQYIGGIVGQIYSNSCIINNCLNTGTVETKATTKTIPCIGGIVGGKNTGAILNVQNVLNLTEPILPEAITSSTSAKAYSSIVGLNNDAKNCTIDNAYDASGFTSKPYGTEASLISVCTETDITGDTAKTTLEGFDFGNTWKTVDGSTPILAGFETKESSNGWYDISWYGDGTASTFTLYDKEDLYGFAKLSETTNFSGKTIYLGADIVINEEDATKLSKDKKGTYEWVPIGKKRDGTTGYKFTGTFDGKGHTISGLYVKQDKEAYNGLFYWAYNANVRNFKLSNSYMYSSKGGFGSIVGRLEKGTLDSIIVDETVVLEYESETPVYTGYEAMVGGLAGYSSAAKAMINNCWFAGTLVNKSANMRDTGGFVGQVRGSLTLSNCLGTGHINISNYGKNLAPRAAGMVGYNVGGTLVIKNSVFRGTVENGTYTSEKDGVQVDEVAPVRAFVGINTGNMTVRDCYSEESVDSQYSNYGDTATATVSAQTIKESNKNTFDYANLLKTEYWGVDEKHYPVLTSVNVAPTITPNTDWYSDDAIKLYISNRNELYGFAKLLQTKDFAGKTVYLTSDIVVNSGESSDWKTLKPSYSWISMGLNAEGTGTAKSFAGTFDGQGYTISGLYHNSSLDKVGLFNTLGGTGKIQNLKLENSYFYSTGASVAAVVGETAAGSEIHTVYVGSDVIVESSNSRVAGIVAMSNGGTISKCWNAAQVTATGSGSQYIGGILARANWSTITVKDCINTGIIETKGTNEEPRIGGIVGAAVNGEPTTLTVTNVLNLTKPVKTDSNTKSYSSVVGYQSSGTTCTITNAYDASGFTSNTNVSTSGITACTTESIIGDAAKATLVGFDFNNTWTTVDGGTPILNMSFTLWNTLVDSSNTDDKTLTVTSGEGVVLSIDSLITDESKYGAQGGWTSDDGYHYQAYINRVTLENESQNKVCIAKFDKSGNLESNTSLDLPLYHANDITYNSKKGRLIVCSGYRTLYEIDVNDLDAGIKETHTLSTDVYCIDYNEANDRYVVHVSGSKFQVLNSEFAMIAEHSIENHFKIKCTRPECDSYGYVSQGVACDERYLYFITYRYCYGNHELSDKNQIAVYDWDGKFVTWISLDHPNLEPESISIIGSDIYYTAADLTTKNQINLYKINKLQ